MEHLRKIDKDQQRHRRIPQQTQPAGTEGKSTILSADTTPLQKSQRRPTTREACQRKESTALPIEEDQKHPRPTNEAVGGIQAEDHHDASPTGCLLRHLRPSRRVKEPVSRV